MPRLADCRIAVLVSLGLCSLTLQLRARGLPDVMAEIDRRGARWKDETLPDARIVAIAKRVCRCRVFQLPVFPRECLREAVTLYYVLSRLGRPVRLHVGVRRHAGRFLAHSWVTTAADACVPDIEARAFGILYSHPHHLSADEGAGQ
jgi:hypothetical protein